jgi:hypothetical protein
MQPTIYLLSTEEVTKNTYKITATMIFKKKGWKMWSTSIWFSIGSSGAVVNSIIVFCKGQETS